jgi:hypothetical protein
MTGPPGSSLTIDHAVITVDRMVTNDVSVHPTPAPVRLLTVLGRAYLVLTLATLAGLAALSVTAPSLAPQPAWVHQAIVSVFAVLLLLRLRRAVTGSSGALRATGIISGVLVAVNVVEAQLPDLFPTWMRSLMLINVVVLLGIVATVIRIRVTR